MWDDGGGTGRLGGLGCKAPGATILFFKGKVAILGIEALDGSSILVAFDACVIGSSLFFFLRKRMSNLGESGLGLLALDRT